MYYTYILYSECFNKYYVGHCQNLEARLQRHNVKAVPSTKAYAPWQLMCSEAFLTKAAASKRESEIKWKKSRKYIESLIRNKSS